MKLILMKAKQKKCISFYLWSKIAIFCSAIFYAARQFSYLQFYLIFFCGKIVFFPFVQNAWFNWVFRTFTVTTSICQIHKDNLWFSKNIKGCVRRIVRIWERKKNAASILWVILEAKFGDLIRNEYAVGVAWFFWCILYSVEVKRTLWHWETRDGEGRKCNL